MIFLSEYDWVQARDPISVKIFLSEYEYLWTPKTISSYSRQITIGEYKAFCALQGFLRTTREFKEFKIISQKREFKEFKIISQKKGI